MTTELGFALLTIGTIISIGAVVIPYRKYLYWKWFQAEWGLGEQSKDGKTAFKDGQKRLLVSLVVVAGILLATFGSYF